MRSPAIAIAALGLLFGTAACGDDDTTTDPDPTEEATDDGGASTPNRSGEVEGAPIAVEDLRACLEGAGLEPGDDNDSVMFGVDDPYFKLVVQLEAESSDPDTDLVAELYVFDEPPAAESNRAAITLSNEDQDLRSMVVENVLLHYSIISSYDQEGSAAVEACLEDPS
jgi:hypothetical protein